MCATCGARSEGSSGCWSSIDRLIVLSGLAVDDDGLAEGGREAGCAWQEGGGGGSGAYLFRAGGRPRALRIEADVMFMGLDDRKIVCRRNSSVVRNMWWRGYGEGVSEASHRATGRHRKMHIACPQQRYSLAGRYTFIGISSQGPVSQDYLPLTPGKPRRGGLLVTMVASPESAGSTSYPSTLLVFFRRIVSPLSHHGRPIRRRLPRIILLKATNIHWRSSIKAR